MQDDGKAIHVTDGRNGPSLQLLRGHVPERSNGGVEGPCFVSGLGYAEIPKQGFVVMIDKDVGRLDVTVDHAIDVGVI